MFCFPFAGGSAQNFRTWHEGLPPSVEVCAVQLPGRETRMRETPFSNVIPMVEAMIPAINPYLDRPFVLFGHSMGALIAFELARKLRRDHKMLPECLVVSGRGAPHVPIPRAPINNLPQPEFIEGLKQLNGTPKEVLENEVLMQLITPLLRADLAVHEDYVYAEEAPLTCDILAFGGLHDSEVGRDGISAWRGHTEGEFLQRMVPGDHFFIQSAQSLFLRMLSSELYQVIKKIKPATSVSQALAFHP
jgi:medium-chain acyl-[acyl-carrier-protein] hydrolase